MTNDQSELAANSLTEKLVNYSIADRMLNCLQNMVALFFHITTHNPRWLEFLQTFVFVIRNFFSPCSDYSNFVIVVAC